MELKPIVRRFLKKRTAVFGLVLLVAFILMATIGPFLCTQSPYEQDYTAMNAPFSAAHPLGTDYIGRDTLTRLVYGSRVSITISFLGVLGGAFIGVMLGLLAGYFGGVVDMVISWVLTILLSFPGILIALIIITILGNGTVNTMVAIMIFNIPSMARIIRGQSMSIREQEYVLSSRVVGATSLRTIMTHVLPNCLSLIIVNCTLNFGTGILTTAGLSYLGLGVQPPTPEWGTMISSAKDYLRAYPEGVIVPGIAITLVVMAFSLFGDGLRDALDPKMRN